MGQAETTRLAGVLLEGELPPLACEVCDSPSRRRVSSSRFLSQWGEAGAGWSRPQQSREARGR